MTASTEQGRAVQTVDAATRRWRQGDFVLGAHWFVFRLTPQHPLTDEAAAAAAEESDLAETEVRGLMLLTQSCDIVRSAAERPFVEVAPLVEVDEQRLQEIRSGRRPRYAYLPAAQAQRLVADLDRVMTIEKSVLTTWRRQTGCHTDTEARQLARALARKRSRAAFPDDFALLAGKLQKRLQEKHSKQSPEGRALRALREIRVRAAPSWEAAEIELMFWFIRSGDEPSFEGETWDNLLAAWLKLLACAGRFKCVDGIVATLDDLTARDYVESDRLDLDHLSES